MTKRMLIDATHPEETRVVAVSGNRLEEFDFETSTKKQLKGNIYLAKVTRVEPSLQAAFVDYGGNRHGFLAFSEIHPDYYRIPIADREALIREEAERHEEPEDVAETGADDDAEREAAAERERDPSFADEMADEDEEPPAGAQERESDEGNGPEAGGNGLEDAGERPEARDASEDSAESTDEEDDEDEDEEQETRGRRRGGRRRGGRRRSKRVRQDDDGDVETVGGDEIDDVNRRRRDWFRKYRIQEVISRRQIMLVQVAKEERGNKGAALTTFISLAGRYCVLMPNTPRGGGISRKITNAGDRKRLKSMLDDFDIPEGMAVIVRTAGMERTKAEVRRDYEYLIKLWDDIRERTLQSTAPALIHEEANLIKRSIRDVYTKDLDEVLVDGEEGYKTAKEFMKMMMPSHAKKVKRYHDDTIPLFHRYQVEQQLDNIHSPVVQLKSGGYVVLNSTEALVAIDVNSGRSTRERNIEETAYRTNLEAAEEIARQLRLRDLAGLVVIDFIDMDEARNRANVERKLKEAMRSDRARIQIGRISPFGLLELSRQRLRPSLVEASTQMCPHCAGTGTIRSTESTALHILRAIEEEGMRKRSAELTVYVPGSVALYILNQKRDMLGEIEGRHGFRVYIEADDDLVAPDHRIERVGLSGEEYKEAAEERDEEAKSKSRRRRGGRKRKERDEEDQRESRADEAQTKAAQGKGDGGEEGQSGDGKSRRRGRRGGRKRRKPEEIEAAEAKPETGPGEEESGATTPAEAAEEVAQAEERDGTPVTVSAAEAGPVTEPAEEKPAEKPKTKSGAGRKRAAQKPKEQAEKAKKPGKAKPGKTAKSTKAKEPPEAKGNGADAEPEAEERPKAAASKPDKPEDRQAPEAPASEKGEEESGGARRTGWWSLRR